VTNAATTILGYPTTADRCLASNSEGGRCQLLDGHDGPHAVALPESYLTWTTREHETYRWSMLRPPPWLIDLSWMPGAQPGLRPA
jgi:hypothetical protein